MAHQAVPTRLLPMYSARTASLGTRCLTALYATPGRRCGPSPRLGLDTGRICFPCPARGVQPTTPPLARYCSTLAGSDPSRTRLARVDVHEHDASALRHASSRPSRPRASGGSPPTITSIVATVGATVHAMHHDRGRGGGGGDSSDRRGSDHGPGRPASGCEHVSVPLLRRRPLRWMPRVPGRESGRLRRADRPSA